MPTALKPVPPFYDNNSTTALPDNVELFSGAHHPTTLLAEEVLSPAGLDAVTSPVKITIISTSSEGPHQPRSRRPTPMPAPEFRLAPSRNMVPQPHTPEKLVSSGQRQCQLSGLVIVWVIHCLKPLLMMNPP